MLDNVKPKRTVTVRKKGRHRTRVEWQHLIDKQASSSLSKSEFCKQESISVTSFNQWLKKLTGSSSQPQTTEKDPYFIDLLSEQESAPISKHSRWHMELSLPGGAVLTIKKESYHD